MSPLRSFFLLTLVSVFTGGCASVPYRMATPRYPDKAVQLKDDEPQIERGRPVALVDAIGFVVGLPSKIILLNMDIDNHRISSRTETFISDYLAFNNLTNVKVRLNQYAPGGEWKRLVRNKRVAWPWRYTIGVISCAFYTLLPGRILGGDNYNPWTDTISIYSDHIAVAVHEGGHAKDFAKRTYPGWYGFAYMLPLVALHHEAKASNDAISYMRLNGTAQEERDAYMVLYPAYATYIGGSLAQYFFENSLVAIAAVIPGHIIGRTKAHNLPDDRPGAPGSGM